MKQPLPLSWGAMEEIDLKSPQDIILFNTEDHCWSQPQVTWAHSGWGHDAAIKYPWVGV